MFPQNVGADRICTWRTRPRYLSLEARFYLWKTTTFSLVCLESGDSTGCEWKSNTNKLGEVSANSDQVFYFPAWGWRPWKFILSLRQENNCNWTDTKQIFLPEKWICCNCWKQIREILFCWIWQKEASCWTDPCQKTFSYPFQSKSLNGPQRGCISRFTRTYNSTWKIKARL